MSEDPERVKCSIMSSFRRKIHFIYQCDFRKHGVVVFNVTEVKGGHRVKKWEFSSDFVCTLLGLIDIIQLWEPPKLKKLSG